MMTLDKRSATTVAQSRRAQEYWHAGWRSKSREDGPRARVQRCRRAEAIENPGLKARIRDRMRIFKQGFGPAIFLGGAPSTHSKWARESFKRYQPVSVNHVAAG